MKKPDERPGLFRRCEITSTFIPATTDSPTRYPRITIDPGMPPTPQSFSLILHISHKLCTVTQPHFTLTFSPCHSLFVRLILSVNLGMPQGVPGAERPITESRVKRWP
jgi:hypothetical protein